MKELKRRPRTGKTKLSTKTRKKPRVSITCTYCRGRATESELAYCAACLAPHHGDCFEEHGGCSVLGCEEDELVQAQPSVKKRQRKRRQGNTRHVDQLANMSLILGVLAILSSGLFAPFAVIKAGEAKRAAAAARVRTPPSAQTGQLLGWISIGFFVLALVWIMFVFSSMQVRLG